MNRKLIGIFDSGLGGITVFEKIKNILPQESIIYLGDTKNFPYGNKTKEKIIDIAIKNTEILINKGAKIVVVACGTATSQSIDVLREKFDIPIIGIIEPTVEYIKQQHLKRIGVMATEGTIRSNEWEKKLKLAIPEIEVESRACPGLATVVEEGKKEEARKIIKKCIQPFKNKHIDKIILGCTHYPIYEDIIREELGYEATLINTGGNVAEELKRIIGNETISRDSAEYHIYVTKPEEKFKEIVKNITNIELKIECINAE